MNSKTLASILSILLSAATVWFLVLPAYSDIKTKNIQLSEEEAKTQEMEKIVSKLESLEQSYKEKENKAAIILEMSPKGKSIPTLLNQMESLSSQSGVILYSLNFSEEQKNSGSSGGDQANSSQKIAKKSKTLPATMKLSGTYEAFKNFLTDLERNSRLADVQTYSFSGKGDNTSSLYDFDLNALFYYQ